MSGLRIFGCLLVVLIILIPVGLWILFPPYYLKVEDVKGHTLLTLPLEEDEQFALAYSHSVHRTPVSDIFQVSPEGELLLIATEFSSLGVGTPFLPEEGKLVEENGKLILTGLNRSFAQLQIRPHFITEHQLLHRQAKYLLTDYTESGSLVNLYVEKGGLSRLLQPIFERRKINEP